MEMSELEYITCLNCGGTFQLPKVASAVKCPYCGYTLIFQDVSFNDVPVYFLPSRISRNRAIEVYLEELNKQVGVSEGLADKVKRSDVKLFFVPMAVFEVEAKGEIKYRNHSGDVCYAGSVAVSVNPEFSWLDGLYVPAAGRIPLDPNRVKDAVVVKIKAKDFSNVENRAKRQALRKLRTLAERRGCIPSNVEIKADLKAIVYYPIYYLKYLDMHALLEGVEGEVIFGMYNPKASVRAYAIGGCAFILAAAIAGIMLSHKFWPIVVGVAGMLPLSKLAVTKKRTFGLKAGEDIDRILKSLKQT